MLRSSLSRFTVPDTLAAAARAAGDGPGSGGGDMEGTGADVGDDDRKGFGIGDEAEFPLQGKFRCNLIFILTGTHLDLSFSHAHPSPSSIFPVAAFNYNAGKVFRFVARDL